ncbi:hypothetical protein B0H14DRAFT_3860514, partial [Mycena olivaceomarginata]
PWHHLRKLRKVLLLLHLELAPGSGQYLTYRSPSLRIYLSTNLRRSQDLSRDLKPLKAPKKKAAPKPTDGSNSESEISDVEPVVKPKKKKKKSAIEYDLDGV